MGRGKVITCKYGGFCDSFPYSPSLGRLLEPLIQDACAFYEDHALFDNYTGVVLETGESDRIAATLGERKYYAL